MSETRTLPDRLKALWPWEPCYHTHADGVRQHFVDVGQGDTPVVMLHGNPTWAFMWREVIRALAPTHRCIAIDHVGCGLSDKPPASRYPYRLVRHNDNVEAILDSLGINRFSLILHDWGGGVGMGVATRRPDPVDRMVLLNTAAWRSLRIPRRIALARIPGFGQLAVQGLNLFATVASRTATHKGLPEDVRQGYLWPYNTWGNRVATLRFVKDVPLRKGHPTYPELARIEDGLASLKDKPTLIGWGMEDFCFTDRFLNEWRQFLPQAEIHEYPGCGHYVIEDADDELIPEITRFFQQ